MSKFFIHRPIFAWVIAIFVIIAGVISITKLPVAQFPSVAPPTINVTATYPGATSQTMTDSVLQLIEREINGAQGLMYMEASAPAGGQGTLTVTFAPGTNPDLAQVDVQNRLSRVLPRLPQVVQALGVRVDKSMSNFLMILAFQAESGETSRDDIADYVNRNVVPEIQRLDGVADAGLGEVQLLRRPGEAAALHGLEKHLVFGYAHGGTSCTVAVAIISYFFSYLQIQLCVLQLKTFVVV